MTIHNVRALVSALKRGVFRFPYLAQLLIGVLEFSRRVYTKTFLWCGDTRSKSEQSHIEKVEPHLFSAGCLVYEPPLLLRQSTRFVDHHDAYLIGNPPVGVTSEGKIIEDTIFRTDERTFAAVSSLHIGAQREIGRLNKGKQLKTKSVSMPTCSLTSAWNHFGHFIPEHFLKLYHIQEKFDINEFQYVIESHAPRWKQDLLFLAGVKQENVLHWTGQSLKFERLFVPSYPEISGESFDWICSLFPRSTVAPPTLKLYLSRQNMSSRFIINEAEVAAELVSHGFQIIEPENLTLEKQVALFQSACCIAGPSGSAFTNQIFMTPGSNVVEFFGSERIHYFNRQVSEVKGHNHHVLLDPRTGSIRNKPGVLVDIEQLRRLLLGIENKDN